jgi:hypothetical protein
MTALGSSHGKDHEPPMLARWTSALTRVEPRRLGAC